MIVDFEQKRNKRETANAKKEKARAKKIYSSIKKARDKGAKFDLDPVTVEFLQKYGYEV